MALRAIYSLCFFFLAALTPPATFGANDNMHSNLTILADEALIPPLSQLARRYSLTSNTPITLVMLNPDSVILQLEEGMEGHILITAEGKLLAALGERGLMNVGSRKTVARSGMVLVATSERVRKLGLASRISFASVLKATKQLPILTSDKNTPEGARALALESHPTLGAPLADRIAPQTDIEEVFTQLRDRDVLGLILSSQAIGEPDIQIVSLLPDALVPAVSYDAVVLGGELMPEANTFLDFLDSAYAKEIFNRSGYQLPAQAP